MITATIASKVATSSVPPQLVAGLSVTTSTTVGAYVTFADQACNSMTIENQYNTAIEYQRNGTGAAMVIGPRQTRTIVGITNANQIGVRRSDNATSRSTQAISIIANCYNRTETYSGITIVQNVKTGGGYSGLNNIACTAVDIYNASTKKFNILRNSNAGPIVAVLMPRESVLITGLTNLNNLFVGTADGSGQSSLLSMETFNTISPLSTLSYYARSEVLSENARVYLGDMQQSAGAFAADKEAFVTLPMFSPFRRHRKGKTQVVSMFRNVTSTLTPAATNLTDFQVGITNTLVGWNNIDGTTTTSRLRYTWTDTSTQSFTTSVNAVRGINTQSGLKGSIHIQVNHSIQTRYQREVNIDLFSAGTPGSPDANYHTFKFDPTFWNTGMHTGIHGAFGFHINRFTAVGSGADLTAITYARIRISGQSGETVDLGDITFVPNVDSKAKIIFTYDDGFISPITVGLPIMARYGYPGVLFPSPAAKTVGGYQSIPADMLLHLQNHYGWQIAGQDYYNETSRDMTAFEWLEYQSRNFTLAAMMGYDTDGIRDGSWYGGGTYPTTTEQMRLMPRLYASACTFYNGQGNSGDTNPPFESATTFPLADPYRIPRLNFSSFSNTDPTAMAAKHKLHVDQAIAVSGVAVYAMHSDLNNANTVTAFSQLIEYIRDKELAGQCEVVTLRDLRKNI